MHPVAPHIAIQGILQNLAISVNNFPGDPRNVQENPAALSLMIPLYQSIC